MIFSNRIQLAAAFAVLGITGIAGNLFARENINTSTHKDALRTSVTGCQPAIASIDLDINNVRARLMTGGDMWWNQGLQVAAYEVPIGSGKSSQFAASCWIGGYDQQNQLKVAAQTYRQDGNDYWPGALDPTTAKITSDVCANWDRFWKVDKATINKFIELSKAGQPTSGSQFDAINQWPGNGNTGAVGANGTPLTLYSTATYAPFIDLNGNGIYEPGSGEYPGFADTKNQIKGDEMIWWVFNDAGNTKQQSQTASMGIEVQAYAFAYSSQDFLNNATFGNYRVINRGSQTIDSTYIAVWDDCDLGYAFDDFIGCDTARGLGIQYNGVLCDGAAGGYPVNSYGCSPPQVGMDFFQGPKRIVHRAGLPDTTQQLNMTNFTYYNNDGGNIGNPTNGIQIYNYMTGSIRNGDLFSDDFKGAGVQSKGYGSGPASHFVFTGDPGEKTTWSECTCNNTPGDRRFIFSSGPFVLLPGAVNDITFGCIWAPNVGGCPNTDFKTIKNIDDGAQALFDAGFKKVEGPQAPRLVIRELDRRLVFYMVNDYGSNNYAENYGRNDGSYADSLNYHQVVTKSKDISNDSLYHFEGYRVFQLANSQVTPADIFDAVTGEVDNTKAYEVKQCDIQNGISKIVNYSLVSSVSDSTYMPQIKVNGKDSGIIHSFEITQDQFSNNSDKILINYQSYYFVAIAYAYNNFAAFNPRNFYGSQDQAYLGSTHGAGYIDIPVYTAIPNPANGDMGTILNADYGSGIVVTRVEGYGNGGNVVELSDASNDSILATGSVAGAVYNQGQGPVNIKVIDPVKVPAYDWVFQVKGSVVGNYNFLADTSNWTLTALDNGQVVTTIYSERDISSVNEQIIEKYGLSVSVNQVHGPGLKTYPGNNDWPGNGYLTSNVLFEDQALPWMWGVQDQADSNFANWLRSGNNTNGYTAPRDPYKNPCDFNDNNLDTTSAYENMFANFNPMQSTWGPYPLAAYWNGDIYGTGTQCSFQVAYAQIPNGYAAMAALPDVNLVFTSDKSKWTRCAVIEEQEDSTLSENHASKFYLRRHKGWDLAQTISGDGMPVYTDDAKEAGKSWFPGYAIDQSGKRLNIVFGEDSYLATDNGKDMLWNPTATIFNQFDGSIVYGGKHLVFVLSTKYDSCNSFCTILRSGFPANPNLIKPAYLPVSYIGLPTLNPSIGLLSLKDGLIPTTTTLRFRVTRPFAPYLANTDTAKLLNITRGEGAQPYYTFSTKNLAPTPLSDNPDKSGLLSKINVVPNPYYGMDGYETNRFDTKVKIINLPANVTVHIYSLDGTLVRTLTKSDPNTSYLDWDIRNTAGLPVASGMYLMDVKAEGIGERVLKWFGAMRPIDASSY